MKTAARNGKHGRSRVLGEKECGKKNRKRFDPSNNHWDTTVSIDSPLFSFFSFFFLSFLMDSLRVPLMMKRRFRCTSYTTAVQYLSAMSWTSLPWTSFKRSAIRVCLSRRVVPVYFSCVAWGCWCCFVAEMFPSLFVLNQIWYYMLLKKKNGFAPILFCVPCPVLILCVVTVYCLHSSLVFFKWCSQVRIFCDMWLFVFIILNWE